MSVRYQSFGWCGIWPNGSARVMWSGPAYSPQNGGQSPCSAICFSAEVWKHCPNAVRGNIFGTGGDRVDGSAPWPGVVVRLIREAAIPAPGGEHCCDEQIFAARSSGTPTDRANAASGIVGGEVTHRYMARRARNRGTVTAWRIPAKPGDPPAVGNRPKVVMSECAVTGRVAVVRERDFAGGGSETNETSGCAPPAAHPDVETIPAGVFQVFLRIFVQKVWKTGFGLCSGI